MRLVVEPHLLAFEVLLVVLLQYVNLMRHLLLLLLKRHQILFIDLADRSPYGAVLALDIFGWSVKVWLLILLWGVENVTLKRVLFRMSSRA